MLGGPVVSTRPVRGALRMRRVGSFRGAVQGPLGRGAHDGRRLHADGPRASRGRRLRTGWPVTGQPRIDDRFRLRPPREGPLAGGAGGRSPGSHASRSPASSPDGGRPRSRSPSPSPAPSARASRSCSAPGPSCPPLNARLAAPRTRLGRDCSWPRSGGRRWPFPSWATSASPRASGLRSPRPTPAGPQKPARSSRCSPSPRRLRRSCVAGCDPALGLLAGPLERHRPPTSLVWWSCNNAAGRELLGVRCRARRRRAPAPWREAGPAGGP